MTEKVNLIEAELRRLGWLGTRAEPCYYVVSAENDLPRGWVRVYDDYTDGYGPADEVLAALKDVEAGADYGTGCPTAAKPKSTRDWPSDLFMVEQLEEGTVNDNPNTLVTVETNAGTRYAAGPHGVSYCALSVWFSSGQELAESRGEAIDSGT